MESTNITIPKKEIAPGVFTTGGIATVPQNSPATVITPQSLQSQPRIDLNGTTVTPTIDTSIVNGATQNANQFDTDYQRMLNLQQTSASDSNALSKSLQELLGAENALGGQGQAQLIAETQLGLPTLTKERASNQGLIKTGIAEYNALKSDFDALSANLEAGAGRKGLTTSALLGQQGAIERQKLARLNSKASEIGILQAKDLALAGDIEAAQNTVNRAIDLAYKDKEAAYQTKLNQYNRIKGFLTEEEAKRGKALEYALKKEESALKEVKDFQKTILNNAISSNAPSSVINAISKGQSIEEITKAGAGYLQSKADKLENQLKQLQINKLSQEITTNAAKNGVSTKDLPLIVKSAEDKIGKIQGLIENTKGLTSSSGTILRRAAFSNKIRDWRADVKNVLSDLTVDELGRVKANGVTFGALSEGERKAVGDAASALNAAARTDKDGKLTGYFDISESKIRDELKTIQDYAKIDFERRTGVSYDNYIASKKPVTESSYATQLLQVSTSSPFNIFGN